MICYIDTQVAIWLNEANLAKFSKKALSLIQAADVRISPMALVELEYLYEIGRIIVKPQEILVKLGAEIGLTVCDHPFPAIADMALSETWTRDPFDRIIVAHAKSNGAAPLLTKDEHIRANYPNARW
ncbi:MAG TPA: PIN domain-containing protein [Candidatus Limnocylindrales bacterium]|nr:PIN domain-containing protein [Candidatus Limnocylindrales bacterium]